MGDRQFEGLRQEHRDAVAARKTIGFQDVGKTARLLGDFVERGARGRAVLVDIDQRQPLGAIRVTVAARGRHVEARRDIPAEVAVELVVG